MSRRVSFSPEAAAIYSELHGAVINKVGLNKEEERMVTLKIWINCKLPKGGSGSSSRSSSVGSFFRNIGAKMSKALASGRCSGKVSNNSSAASLARSRSYAAAAAETQLDYSHRAEAIEDCIEFLNNSSLQRSSSVNSSSC